MKNVVYKIHTNDGSKIDGMTVSSKKKALANVRRHCGLKRAYLLEYPHLNTTEVFGCHSDKLNQAYGVCIERIEVTP